MRHKHKCKTRALCTSGIGRRLVFAVCQEEREKCALMLQLQEKVTTAPTVQVLEPKSCATALLWCHVISKSESVFTHSVTVVTDFDDRFILPEVPNHCLATGVSGGQNMLHLPIPRHHTDIFMRLQRQKWPQVYYLCAEEALITGSDARLTRTCKTCKIRLQTRENYS